MATFSSRTPGLLPASWRRRTGLAVLGGAMSLAVMVGFLPAAFALAAPTVTATLTPAGPIMYGESITTLEAEITGIEPNLSLSLSFSSPVYDPTGTVDFGYCFSTTSTPVSCPSPTSIASGVAVGIGTLADGVSTATESSWTPPSVGYYLVTMDYSGDGIYEGDVATAALEVEAPTVTIAYTGDTYRAGAGNVTFSANITSDADVCLLDEEGTVEFAVLDGEGNAITGSPFAGTPSGTTSASSTQSLALGIYSVTAVYDPGTDCGYESDAAIISVVSTASGTLNGGGWYRRGDYEGDGSTRANFGLVMNRTYTGTGRTKTWSGFKGQFVWLSSQGWRVKTGFTGGTDFFGVYPCPTAVGAGSGAICGTFRIDAVLEYWDGAANGGLGGWAYEDDVTVTVWAYDGGSVTICKKRTCTRTDVADWFGIDVAGYTFADLPETQPWKLAPSGGKGTIKAIAII